MKWVKRLLMLSVGVMSLFLGWNFIVQPGVVAQAATQSYKFTLRPVDESGNTIFLNGSGSSDLAARPVSGNYDIDSQTTYQDILDQEKANGSGVDYVQVWKDYSKYTVDDAGPNGLLYDPTNPPSGVDGELVSGMYDIWNNLKDAQPTRYTLDVPKFEQNLKAKVGSSGATVDVPFQKLTAGMSVSVIEVVDGTTSPVIPISKVHGVKGQQIDLTETKFGGMPGFTYLPSTLTFDGSPDQEETFKIVQDSSIKQVTIHYVKSDGSQAAPDKVVQSYGSEKETEQSPTVAGYQPDKASVAVDFTGLTVNDSNGQGTNPAITVTYSAKPTTESGTVTAAASDSSSTADQAMPAKIFKVYGKQRLYRYRQADFKQSDRIQGYAKKVIAYAPVFTVVKTVKSSQGTPRYELADGSYITANPAYVGRLYWRSSAYKTLYVTSPKGIYVHPSAALTKRGKYLKQGTAVNVVKAVKVGQKTRYELSNGTFITGNKQFVSPTTPKTVVKVKSKTKIGLYHTANLDKKIKTYKRGTTIKITGWDYSHGRDTNRSGVQRFRTAGGYITANRQYVAIIK